MNKDRKIIAELAREYAAFANDSVNEERLKLHKAVNDLHMIRPVVLLNEIPWNEMNFNGELTLKCEDPWLREVEQFLRQTIFQQKYFPADTIVKPYIPVQKVVLSSGIGVEIDDTISETNHENVIKSHEYHDQFTKDEDIEKLHNAVISYDEAKTNRHADMISECVGDIIPVRKTGIGWFPVVTWDDIAQYRGVTPLLYDLVDRPEFMHQLAEKLTDIQLDILKQYEELGLLDNDPAELHCTAAETDDLPRVVPGESITRKNIWGRGAAQIFASVGKDMHEEFDIEYMKKTIGTCGLAYYGCCEPLDKKIDIVEKIPNLRKISITPWADVDVAAETIGNRYVIASKPTPASVAVEHLDVDVLRKEITKILDACNKNNCSCDLVLKDISTCHKNPENIFLWEKTVMEMVKNY